MTSTAPTGTVTFLFTDIEGSTKLAFQVPDQWEALRARHIAILRSAIESQKGHVFQIIGDAFCAAFHTAGEALRAAIESQVTLHAENWGDKPVKVRMGIHTGKAEFQEDGSYSGYVSLCRVQRLMSAGHGGQTLVSQAASDLLGDELPEGVSFRDLGEHRLKDLTRPEHIFQLLVPGLPVDFPALKTLDIHSNNLPVQLTSFIGREKEIGEIKRLLNEKRLVTITGPGGTGKTRLALQIAAELLGSFPSGVWLVELAQLADPALLAQAVAAILGLRIEDNRPTIEILTGFLHEKKVLLILDNCEHLIDACAQLAGSLLQACPQVTLLTSSREPLGIAGEVAYRVPPLSLPGAALPNPETLVQCEAVQLFVERACSVLPAFMLTDDNAESISQVCSRLDGIPLALELAAARVRLLSVEQIATRLDDRFRLLTGGSRTALPRQQTLQALIDWSWDLLSHQEAELLKRLAVFSGGWDLEAAEQVCAGDGIECADILELLAQLVNKSLVAVGDESGAQRRYSLLETIRQYAGVKLQQSGDAPTCRNRHLFYFSSLAGQAAIELHRRRQKQWLKRLDAEYDNLRIALEWAINIRPEEALIICAGLADFWDVRGYLREGLAWATRALQATQALPPSPAGVETLYAAAMLAARQTDIEQFQAFTEEGLGMARKVEYRRGIARGLLGKVMITEYWNGNPEQAADLYADSLRLWREEGDKLGIGQALGPHAHRLYANQDYAGAERLFNESLALFRELEDQREIAGALENLAEVALAREDRPVAAALAEESLSLYRELEDKHGIATALRTLGQTISPQAGAAHLEELFEESCRLLREMNDRGCLSFSLATGGRAILAAGLIVSAREMIREGLALVRETGEPEEGTASVLEGAAELLLAVGRWSDSARVFGAAEAYRQSIPVSLTLCEQSAHNQAITTLRAGLDKRTLSQAWEEGNTMSMEKVIEMTGRN